jgi:predicted nuclease of predicted toxin-antitoxin system
MTAGEYQQLVEFLGRQFAEMDRAATWHARTDRVVITFDLGFGDLAALARDRPARVILFRLSNARTPHVIERPRPIEYVTL